MNFAVRNDLICKSVSDCSTYIQSTHNSLRFNLKRVQFTITPRLSGEKLQTQSFFVPQFPKETWVQRKIANSKFFCPSVPKRDLNTKKHHEILMFVLKASEPCRILIYRTCYYKNLQIHLSVQRKVTTCRILSRENKIHHRTLALNHSSYEYFFSLRKPHKQPYFWYLSIYTSYNETLL